MTSAELGQFAEKNTNNHVACSPSGSNSKNTSRKETNQTEGDTGWGLVPEVRLILVPDDSNQWGPSEGQQEHSTWESVRF